LKNLEKKPWFRWNPALGWGFYHGHNLSLNIGHSHIIEAYRWGPFGPPLYSIYMKVQLLRKTYGIKCGSTGNILRNTLGTWGSLCETTLRTILEQIGKMWECHNSKTSIPTPISLGGTTIGSYTISSYQNRFFDVKFSLNGMKRCILKYVFVFFRNKPFFSTP